MVLTVLITGCASGIGRATAFRFVQAGWRIAAADINGPSLAATSKEIEAMGGVCYPVIMDIRSEESVEAAVSAILKDCGRIDALINNASGSLGTDILKMDLKTWNAGITLALTSVYLVTRAVLPAMLEQGKGSIVNVSSVNSLIGFGEEAYGASKAGMNNLTENIAARYGKNGIRANTVAPGTIATPAWYSRMQKHPHILDNLVKHYPVNRLGKPEEVASAIYFLASDDASFITGALLRVDGGLLAGNNVMMSELMPQ